MRMQRFSDTHQRSETSDPLDVFVGRLQYLSGEPRGSHALRSLCLRGGCGGGGHRSRFSLVRFAAVLLSGLLLGCYGNFRPDDAATDSSVDADLPEEDGDLEEVSDADAESTADTSPDADEAADASSDTEQTSDAEDADDDDDSCVRDCRGVECGPDGCGGLCGTGCSPNEMCREGHCQSFQLDSTAFVSCAVIEGLPYCWGENNEGQIGDGTTISRVSPRAVSTLTDVVQISTSGSHTCAVVAGGQLWCWGYNSMGEVGGEIWTNVEEPRRFDAVSEVRSVQCGSHFTCVNRSDGSVWCWGEGNHGRLGHGTEEDRTEPVEVVDLSGVVGLSAGDARACAWTEEDQVFCWGSNSFSTIDDSGQDHFIPVDIPDLEGLGVRDIALGRDHSCALTDDGETLCWGANDCGQLGIGVYSYAVANPETVLGLGRITAISSDYNHTCALDEDRRGFCWGEGTRGELLGSEEECVNLPLEIPELFDLTGIVAGWHNSCTWTELGELWCWGANNYGMLGVGDSEDRAEATQVDLP